MKIIKIKYARIVTMEHVIEIPDSIDPYDAALALEAGQMLGIESIDPKEGSHVEDISDFAETWEVETITEGVAGSEEWPEWLNHLKPDPRVAELPF